MFWDCRLVVQRCGKFFPLWVPHKIASPSRFLVLRNFSITSNFFSIFSLFFLYLLFSYLYNNFAVNSFGSSWLNSFFSFPSFYYLISLFSFLYFLSNSFSYSLGFLVLPMCLSLLYLCYSCHVFIFSHVMTVTMTLCDITKKCVTGVMICDYVTVTWCFSMLHLSNDLTK